MDVNPETLSMIGDGTIDSTISQKPYTMGYFGLKALDEASRSKTGAVPFQLCGGWTFAVSGVRRYGKYVDFQGQSADVPDAREVKLTGGGRC